MRPIWKGGISFGLIYIPINLYSATQSVQLDLDYLSKKDLAPIRYAKIDTKTGKEVAWKDVVKGYEYKEGDYVILDETDFEKANIKKSETIEIVSFVDSDEIDTKYFDKPYYLEPEKGAKKTYALLREALKKANKVGIAEFVLRNREHLVVLKPEGDMLLLNQLRYESEIRSPEDLEVPGKEELKEKELAMAMDLIDTMTDKFDPKDFKDDYIKDLKKIIDAKAHKRTFKVEKDYKPTPTEIKDLLGQLQKSLAEVKKHQSKG